MCKSEEETEEGETHCTNSPINSIDFGAFFAATVALCVFSLCALAVCDVRFIAHVANASALFRHSKMFIECNKE